MDKRLVQPGHYKSSLYPRYPERGNIFQIGIGDCGCVLKSGCLVNMIYYSLMIEREMESAHQLLIPHVIHHGNAICLPLPA